MLILKIVNNLLLTLFHCEPIGLYFIMTDRGLNGHSCLEKEIHMWRYVWIGIIIQPSLLNALLEPITVANLNRG